MFGIHGTKSYLCIVKGYSRQGMSDKERSLILFSSGFVPFLSRQGFVSRYKALQYR